MSDSDDYHLRFQVVETGFSKEDEAIHAAGIAFITRQIAKGKPWEEIVKGLKIADPELKGLVVDDFVKITLAQKHFAGERPLKELSKELRIPMEVLIAARKSMLSEVEEASVKAYHLTQEQQRKANTH